MLVDPITVILVCAAGGFCIFMVVLVYALARASHNAGELEREIKRNMRQGR